MTLTTLFRHPRLLVMGAAQCLLLGFLTHLLLQQPHLPLLPKNNLAALPEMKAPAKPPEATNVEDLYTALTSQPVFHTSRQLVPEHPAPVIPEIPPPAYILTGYLGLPGRAPHAFLQPSSGGKTLIVGLGDSVDGWAVVGVNPRQVELKEGDRSISITKDGNGASRAAAVATSSDSGVARSGAPSAIGNLPPSATHGAITLGNGASAALPSASRPQPLKKPVAVTPKNPPRFFTAPHSAAPQQP